MTALLEECLELWHDCPVDFPEAGRSYRTEEQAAGESHLAAFLDAVQTEARSLPRGKLERRATRRRIVEAFQDFARRGLGLSEAHMQLLMGGGLSAVGTDLARQARRFDPDVSMADIFQANRNAWTACGLQMLLGRKMGLTPSIFAYSMLYPYTDNYLDDPAASNELKAAFNRRFGLRLAGQESPPANPREERIWQLVEMIEGEYTRAVAPQVFESLLGIQQAQVESLRLLRRNPTLDEAAVLRLSFRKGGTSVLADGYLAAGTLTAEQARFVFGWGTLLQLADDLQDVGEDLESGTLTLFSLSAGRRPLDELTNRTLHFAERVMRWMEPLPNSGCEALKQLVARSSCSMLIRSAGRFGEFYTPAYVARLESRSPFRFQFLNQRREQLARWNGLFARLFEASLADEGEPVFPVLPGSLLPRA